MTPDWAPRVAVLLVAATWLTSIAGIAALTRRPASTILLLAPVLFGSAFYAGFFNFLTGAAALLFWARELDDERRDRPWHRLALSTTVGAALLYLSLLCTLAGYAVWGWLLRHLPATSVGFFTFLNPPLASLSKIVLVALFPSVFVWQLSRMELLGGLLAFAGLAIALWPAGPRTALEEPPA